jgi:PAS domain S-box-containing protein
VARRLSDDEGIEYVIDISNRLVAERELRDGERRMRALLEGIPQIVWRAAGQGNWTWASPQWTELTGQPEMHSHGLGWLDMVHPLDREQARQSWQHVSWIETFEADYRLWHVREARFRAFKTRAMPVRDDLGHIVEWLGTSTDVEDLEQLHARDRVLTAELQHRTRNLLALIQSIARQTLTLDEKGPAGLVDFESRLAALGRVQKLLSGSGARVALRELVEAELSAVTGSDPLASLIEGPDVQLLPEHVQTLALALHELATNAVKHGALGTPEGRLAVRWRIIGEDELQLEWQESGVKMPATPPLHRGFGRQLIEEALQFTLNARTLLLFGADGVSCRIDLPLRQTR